MFYREDKYFQIDNEHPVEEKKPRHRDRFVMREPRRHELGDIVKAKKLLESVGMYRLVNNNFAVPYKADVPEEKVSPPLDKLPDVFTPTARARLPILWEG